MTHSQTSRYVLVAVLAGASVCTASTALGRDSSSPPPKEKLTPAIEAGQFLTHAAHLASDELAGRESGTPGGRAAEDYVAKQFAKAGLQPFGEGGTFFEDVVLPMRPMKPDDTTLAVREGEAWKPLGEPTDVVPFAFSENGTVAAPLVFCGYGLVDGDYEWNDYAGINVKGKVVLVLRHGPNEKDPESPWTMGRRTPPAQRMKLAFTTKAQNAVEAGAAALLMVNDRHHGAAPLPARVPGARQPIPVIAVSRAVADTLVAPSGKTIEELQIEVDEANKPASREIGRNVTVTAKLGETLGRNVLAIRRGSDPKLASECVVLGAHLDHVGMGKFGSSAGRAGRGKIHNGADDNASGTAALLELAGFIGAQPAPKRTIIFAGWCGEEMGLVGSRSYVADPRWPLEKTVACINVDMLGRYRATKESDRGLMIEGTGTGSTFAALAEGAAAAEKIRFSHARDGWRQSDHYPFYAAGVPALFFTTGLHAEYHGPDDDWWLLVDDGAAASARAIARVTLAVANDSARPDFAKLPPRPVLGVRLRADKDEPGAVIAFLAPDMAAANAGLVVNDRIVEFDGTAVASDRQMYSLIGAKAPGDVVTLRFYRGSKMLEAKATLSGR